MVTNTPGDFGYVANEDRWRYSYGELLHNIYFSTRIGQTRESSAPFFRKEFMRCILGTHSVQFNEAVRSTESRRDILKVIGSSLAGRWANQMLPVMRINEFEDPSGGGSISLPVRDFFGWKIPEEVQYALMALAQGGVQETRAILYQFFEALTVLGMFFSNVPANGLGICLDIDDDEDLILRSDSGEYLCFNVLNFAINLYDALPEEENGKKGYLVLMQEKLLKLGETFADYLCQDWKHRLADVSELDNIPDYEMSPGVLKRNKMLRERSDEIKFTAMKWERMQKRCGALDATRFIAEWNDILQELMGKYRAKIRRWRHDHGRYSWVLPVENFDMMYNITKRLATVSYYDIADDADASEMFGHYVRLYKNLEEELANQDRVYFRNDKAEKHTFSKAFQDCVFYSAINTPKRNAFGEFNKDYNPFIEFVLVQMLSATARPSSTRRRMLDIWVDRNDR